MSNKVISLDSGGETFGFDGNEYFMKYPSVTSIQNLNSEREKIEGDPVKESELMFRFISERGMPIDVVKELTAPAFQLVVEKMLNPEKK